MLDPAFLSVLIVTSLIMAAAGYLAGWFLYKKKGDAAFVMSGSELRKLPVESENEHSCEETLKQYEAKLESKELQIVALDKEITIRDAQIVELRAELAEAQISLEQAKKISAEPKQIETAFEFVGEKEPARPVQEVIEFTEVRVPAAEMFFEFSDDTIPPEISTEEIDLLDVFAKTIPARNPEASAVANMFAEEIAESQTNEDDFFETLFANIHITQEQKLEKASLSQTNQMLAVATVETVESLSLDNAVTAVAFESDSQTFVFEEQLAEPDDLSKLRGIGEKTKRKLNKLGLLTFRQIAQLDEKQISELSGKFANLKQRISNDGWINAAREAHFEKYGERI